MPEPKVPSQLDSRALWALLPMDIRIQCSYRRYAPEEPFHESREDAFAAGAAICDKDPCKGMIVSSVLVVTLPQGKLVLARDICEGAEQRVRELLTLAQKYSVNAELVWELGFL